MFCGARAGKAETVPRLNYSGWLQHDILIEVESAMGAPVIQVGGEWDIQQGNGFFECM